VQQVEFLSRKYRSYLVIVSRLILCLPVHALANEKRVNAPALTIPFQLLLFELKLF